jgi:futalosine hydrolase
MTPTPSPGSPTLVLVPTELERARLADLGGFAPGAALVDLAGFGRAAAGARTAQRLALLRPARALLLGVAGTYDPERAPVGSAVEFGRVAVDGIGVGSGATHRPPPKLGFPQWPGSSGEPPIYDELALASGSRALLVSTAAASADPHEAALRRARFPDALGEDMEGFAVALACALAGVPLAIVRGFSNVVGDRESTRWRIPAALAAARALALEWLERASPPARTTRSRSTG